MESASPPRTASASIADTLAFRSRRALWFKLRLFIPGLFQFAGTAGDEQFMVDSRRVSGMHCGEFYDTVMLMGAII